MNLELWIDRIREQSALARVVEGAADFAIAAQTVKVFPTVWVVPAAERAAPNELLAGGVEQLVQSAANIVYAVKNVSDSSGRASQDDLRLIRLEVRGILLGWQPDDCVDVVTYMRGSLLGFNENVTWWGDTYAALEQWRAIG